MNLVELPLVGTIRADLEARLRAAGVDAAKAREARDEMGRPFLRFRSPLTLGEISDILNKESVEVPEPETKTKTKTKEVETMNPNDEKTLIAQPAEGIARIGEGLNAMMSAFLAPALQALEAQQRQTQALVQAAQNELKATQAKIQAEISEALEEPKTLFQECLAALDRQEKKLTEIETRSQASKDELLRDVEKLRTSFEKVVKALQGIAP